MLLARQVAGVWLNRDSVGLIDRIPSFVVVVVAIIMLT